jgi:hypothetical protein
MKPIYAMKETREVAQFVDNLAAARADGGGAKAVLDSVKNDPKVSAPPVVEALFKRTDEDSHERILDAVQAGVDAYKREHGVEPTADLIEAALHQGVAMTFKDEDLVTGRAALDSANSFAHDQMSLQPNRAIVAIVSAISEGIPFAGYLPTDIGSNKSILAILTHQAGSNIGSYRVGGSMDGIASGRPYAAGSRYIAGTIDGPRTGITASITEQLSVTDPMATAAGSNVPLLRGRSIVYVNGLIAARELSATGSGASSVGGSAVIAGATYTIGGTINTTTGAVALTATPALPAGVTVEIEVFLNFEANPSLLTPQLITNVDTFELYANAWRIVTTTTIDSTTQLKNELGLDDQSEALIAVRGQVANERFYDALRKMYRIANRNALTAYNFNFSGQTGFKSRDEMFADFQMILGEVDQKMAEDTIDHGVTHLFVTRSMAATMLGLGSDKFVPSGVSARPGIFRVGRLFNKYEVYYCPQVLTESGGGATTEILCVGRSAQTARCPIILGDAVPPTFMPLAFTREMKYENAMYARNYTSVNPHQPSALGAALIQVTGLK